MKIFELLRKVECGDMTLLYMKEGEKVMFTMVPAGMEAQIATHRRSLRKTLGCRGAVRALGCDFPAVRPESLVQFKAAGDAYWDNFSAGCTMRNSGSVDLLKFTGQKEENGAVVTSFADSRGLAVDHISATKRGSPVWRSPPRSATPAPERSSSNTSPAFLWGCCRRFRRTTAPAATGFTAVSPTGARKDGGRTARLKN